VLYYEPGFEITEDVLTEINKDKPAGAPAAAAGSTEAPAVSFPAAGN
jgi:hypothetical protein